MIRFDGIDDRVLNVGLGGFGSNMGSGVSASMWLTVNEVGTEGWLCGISRWATSWQEFRIDTNSLNNNNRTLITLGHNASALYTVGHFTNATLYDGSPHHLVVTVLGSTDTITAYVDGVPQTITYTIQTTPITFVDFTGFEWRIGDSLRGAVHSYAEVDVCDFQLFTGIASQADALALTYALPWMPYNGNLHCWGAWPLRTGMGLNDYSIEGNNLTNGGSTETDDPPQLLWGHGPIAGEAAHHTTTTTATTTSETTPTESTPTPTSSTTSSPTTTTVPFTTPTESTPTPPTTSTSTAPTTSTSTVPTTSTSTIPTTSTSTVPETTTPPTTSTSTVSTSTSTASTSTSTASTSTSTETSTSTSTGTTTSTTSGPTTTSTTGTTATTCLGPHRLYLSAIQTAIHEHLSACATLTALVPGGIHDTMAPPAPHVGTEVYPFMVGTIITADDMSAFCESIQWILYQTDIYHDSMSAVDIGEVSRRLQECLDRKLVVEAYGHYYSFHLHATVARRLKEAPDVWRIGSDFEGLVHRIQP